MQSKQAIERRATGRAHSVFLLLLLMQPFPRQLAIAQAQNVSSADAEHADPCQDPSTPAALKEALRLVCSREPVQFANRDVRKALIIGFVGGFVRRDNIKQPEVLFARYLFGRYGATVHVEIFGNHDGKRALAEVIERLNIKGNGLFTVSDKEPVKIILYGHSWGASQTLAFARELQRHRIPVALTIQIDSVKKFGRDDRTVPDNVAKAVNFYQRKGLTPGQPRIVSADPARTKIIGNFHMTYQDRHINCDNYHWLSRVFNRPHHEIENDPRVWDQVASLIDSEVLTHPRLAPSRFPDDNQDSALAPATSAAHPRAATH